MNVEDILHVHTFLDRNGDKWSVEIDLKGFVIIYHGWDYFVPSFFKGKEVRIVPNGDLDLIDEFIPKSGFVPEGDDLFDFLESLYFENEEKWGVRATSPSKLVVS
jgi:hypothetical protein